MRKKLHVVSALLFLFLLLFTFGGKASASDVSNVNKTAYVDTAKKALVLRFDGFSKKDKYSYSISSKGEVVAKGTTTSSAIYPLKDKYEEGAVYELKVRSAEKDTLTVHFYTQSAIDRYRASQIGQYVKSTWRVRKRGAYDGYIARISKTGQNDSEIEKKLFEGTNKANFMTASFQNGVYDVRLLTYKTVDGFLCYGQGFGTRITIVRVPTRVTRVNAVGDTRCVRLYWDPAMGATYYKVYKANSAGGKYKLARDKIKGTACVVHGLSGGEDYYFKIEPVGAVGSKTVYGPKSVAKGAKVPLVAGRVEKVKPFMDKNKNIFLKWDKTKHATGYYVYYRRAGEKGYTKLGGTRKTKCSLMKLNEDTKYSIVVYAMTQIGAKKYVSNLPSKPVTFNPIRDTDYIISSAVRTIGFMGRHREIYTSKKYPANVKTAYVNSRGYASPTKYLIWISHYTQQVSIFKGFKKNWKLIRSFSVATGHAWTRSPRGVFKIGRKERGWFYSNTKVLYVTHYKGENSFHTRPLYYGGGVATPTLNRPASHGCVRCPNEDAKFIHHKIPRGTTVVSW